MKNKMTKKALRLVTMNIIENSPMLHLGNLEKKIKNEYLPYEGFDFCEVVLNAVRDWCQDNKFVKSDRVKHYSQF